MTSCEPQIQQLLAEQPGYRQAIANLKSDCRSIGNPAANIPVAIEQAIEETCAADPDRSFTEIVEDHQTVRRPDVYQTRNPPDNKPLRRVVALTKFLHRHLLPDPEKTAGYGSYERHASLSARKERYRDMLKSEPESLDNKLFSGTTGRLGTPTWWTFLEAERQIPADAVTYTEELMLDQKDIQTIRREGGVVVLIPAHILAGRTYKPCALDNFRENTAFRPDHSERSYGMTCPTRPDLQGHPELISRSYRYSDWQSQFRED